MLFGKRQVWLGLAALVATVGFAVPASAWHGGSGYGSSSYASTYPPGWNGYFPPGYFISWPNAHWPSNEHWFTYDDGNGNYLVHSPGRQEHELITNADITFLLKPNRALIEVKVPQDGAQVRFEGRAMERPGYIRRYVTPELAPGYTYVYEVSASWNEEDKVVTRNRKVRIAAGDRIVLDFTQPEPK